jgi:hypothetical protein
VLRNTHGAQDASHFCQPKSLSDISAVQSHQNRPHPQSYI